MIRSLSVKGGSLHYCLVYGCSANGANASAADSSMSEVKEQLLGLGVVLRILLAICQTTAISQNHLSKILYTRLQSTRGFCDVLRSFGHVDYAVCSLVIICCVYCLLRLSPFSTAFCVTWTTPFTSRLLIFRRARQRGFNIGGGSRQSLYRLGLYF